MSGLEPLAALSLACNIFQVISFAKETIDIAKKIYQTGTVRVEIEESSKTLIELLAETKLPGQTQSTTRQERQLVEQFKKCENISRSIQDEVIFLTTQANQGSLAATVKTVAKVKWRKNRLSRLEQQLVEAERMLHSGLLASIFAKVSRSDLQWESIDEKLRIFVEQTRNGFKDTAKLLSREAMEVKAHTSRESTATQHVLKSHVTAVAERSNRDLRRSIGATAKGSVTALSSHMEAIQLGQENEAKRQKLLLSLKFPGLNERYNQVSLPHRNTCRWIFDENQGSPSPWDSFPAWLKSDKTIYWISGKPGSGKSTLVKSILAHLHKSRTIMRPGAIILSHFLWRPGSFMQRSIKGLLCSLLYQLILQNSVTADRLLETNPPLALKDSDTDWSREELRNACLQTIETLIHPIYIFIDGLDELTPEEDISDLFQIIADLTHPADTKCCLSSRPEFTIQRRLSQHPTIRTQDMNQKDLRQYAEERISSFMAGDESVRARHNLIELLLDKAHGVFLWLCLAVKSVQRGFEYGDSETEIQERIESLPDDLLVLYQDLWLRHNEDNRVYKRIAARCFRVAMLSTNFIRQLKCERHGVYEQKVYVSLGPHGSLSLLEFAIASTGSSVSDVIDFRGKPYTAPKLLELCEKAAQNIQVRCAGLLEIGNRESYVHGFQWIEGYDILDTYARNRVRFIHRTAFDFLANTCEGQNILAPDTTSSADLRLCLIASTLRVFDHYRRDIPHNPAIKPTDPRIKLLHRYLKPSYHATDTPKHVGSSLLRLIDNLESMFEAEGSGLLTELENDISKMLESKINPFLIFMTTCHFSEGILHYLKHRTLDQHVISAVLFLIVRGSYYATEHNSSDLELINELLDRGADLQWGASLSVPLPHPMHIKREGICWVLSTHENMKCKRRYIPKPEYPSTASHIIRRSLLYLPQTWGKDDVSLDAFVHVLFRVLNNSIAHNRKTKVYLHAEVENSLPIEPSYTRRDFWQDLGVPFPPGQYEICISVCNFRLTSFFLGFAKSLDPLLLELSEVTKAESRLLPGGFESHCENTEWIRFRDLDRDESTNRGIDTEVSGVLEDKQGIEMFFSYLRKIYIERDGRSRGCRCEWPSQGLNSNSFAIKR
ncbi:hypothetical protein GGR57DRAFT_404480 [Xylariaceae sp. FL1272]|nr:hypothetical protein GGR57DRAFT_404480 [Xylariaceae sp. FL1272]